jgi:transitional endoplasmic reticulum ATPase
MAESEGIMEQAKRPEWMEEVLQKYSSGVSVGFILHLNIFDYVIPGVGLVDYLSKVLADRRCVAIYNRAEGIRVALPSMMSDLSQITGWKPDVLNPEPPKQPTQALALLETLLKAQDEAGKVSAVIIEYPETLVPAADIAMMVPEDRNALVTLARWARDPEIVQAGNPIFLLVANASDLHQSIRAASSKYEAVRVPMPDLATRQGYIISQEMPESDISAEEMAKSTAGLSLIHIEDVFLRARQEGKLTWELVRDRKRDIIKSEFGEVLEIMEPRYGFEAVGGLELVKDFFLRSVVVPVRKGNYCRVPMGVLMTGPAGTGKTIMAEAVAKESGINMAILNPAKIFSKWVGESERNLERALECVKSLAPAIVFVDEIDQSMQRGEAGDSGVSNRVFKRLMEFMSDTGHRGQVVFLAATNRPDLMDAALKRPGRFDAKIPFFIPEQLARADIFKVMCRKYGVPAKNFTKSAAETQGWTGAEIEKAVIKARGIYEDDNMTGDKALVKALRYVVPKTQDIEFMTQVAVQECDDLEFLPKKYWPKEAKSGNGNARKAKG